MSSNQFRRYTTLPFLLDILQQSRLALLDPASWEDKNDAYYIEVYKTKKELQSVLALCFADSPETYQHWKIYAGNSSGVCIEFNRDHLLNKLADNPKFRTREVRYELLKNMKAYPPQLDELPFIKRFAFIDEREHRIIYEDPHTVIKIIYIPITSRDISRIVLNPWLNQSVFESVKRTIKDIKGCKNIPVIKSTVVENENWKKIGSQAFGVTQAQIEFVENV